MKTKQNKTKIITKLADSFGNSMVHDNIFLSCDTSLNLLLRKSSSRFLKCNERNWPMYSLLMLTVVQKILIENLNPIQFWNKGIECKDTLHQNSARRKNNSTSKILIQQFLVTRTTSFKKNWIQLQVKKKLKKKKNLTWKVKLSCW